MDGLTTSRHGSTNETGQTDGVDGPILFLAATNSPSSIDPAVLRRFQRTFHVR